MTREQAYQLLAKYMQNKNLLKHSLAAEAGMKAICKHLHPKLFASPEKSADAKALADKWGIAGLLHDLDYEVAQKENKLDKHGILLFEDPMYADDMALIPEEIAHAIKAHNFEGTKLIPKTKWIGRLLMLMH